MSVSFAKATPVLENLATVSLGPNRNQPAPRQALTKQILDMTLATIGLVLLGPLMLISALAIKFESAGPIIFRQRRIGLGGRTFFIYKFRIMLVTEGGPPIRQTQRGDPRVTRIGRVLRRTGIDELPQLFNVLKGEMSIVGPWPHAVARDEYYAASMPNYVNRYRVKPGITGWAQVSGRRGEDQEIKDMEKRNELDLWYIDNWSVALDLRIVWRTLFEFDRKSVY